jgi:acetyl-CoA carboxylase carboxyl transferase subunit alpha
VLLNQLDELAPLHGGALLDRRYQRLRGYGAFTGG